MPETQAGDRQVLDHRGGVPRSPVLGCQNRCGLSLRTGGSRGHVQPGVLTRRAVSQCPLQFLPSSCSTDGVSTPAPSPHSSPPGHASPNSCSHSAARWARACIAARTVGGTAMRNGPVHKRAKRRSLSRPSTHKPCSNCVQPLPRACRNWSWSRSLISWLLCRVTHHDMRAGRMGHKPPPCPYVGFTRATLSTGRARRSVRRTSARCCRSRTASRSVISVFSVARSGPMSMCVMSASARLTA